MLVQERCTKLERALQAAKSAAAAAGESASASAAEVQALSQQLQQSQQLVRQLETDLLALSSSAAAAEAVVRSGSSGLQGLVPAGLDAAAGVSSPSAAAAAAGQEGGGGDGAAAVLQAVAAQRDRFKARIAELEGEQAGLSAQLQQAAATVQRVTQDNVALVEKLRWGLRDVWVSRNLGF